MARLTKRKLDVAELLKANTPEGFGLLNELCMKSWSKRDAEKSESYDNHKRSFNRTLTEHGAPFSVVCFQKTHEGISEGLTADTFARWSLWQLLEKSYLSAIPEPFEMLFVVGNDACSAIMNLENGAKAVVGTTCFLNRIWLVSETEQKLEHTIKEELLCNIPIYGANDTSDLKQIDPKTPVWSLKRLPYYIRMAGNQKVSTARMRIIP